MMHEKDFSEKILLGVTTYSGDFESRLILSKVLRHMRSKNGKNIFLLVVSDGHITDPQVHKLADAVLDRPGPCGLHQGELDSIWEIIRFAQAKGYTKLIKSAGDIIMTHPNWAQTVMKRLTKVVPGSCPPTGSTTARGLWGPNSLLPIRIFWR